MSFYSSGQTLPSQCWGFSSRLVLSFCFSSSSRSTFLSLCFSSPGWMMGFHFFLRCFGSLCDIHSSTIHSSISLSVSVSHSLFLHIYINIDIYLLLHLSSPLLIPSFLLYLHCISLPWKQCHNRQKRDSFGFDGLGHPSCFPCGVGAPDRGRDQKEGYED